MAVIIRERPNDDEIKQWARDQAWGHHASCTCKIGVRSGPMAVLDSNFNVFGTKNLRVVDACVFPHIPGYFIVLPIYMIAEKASDVIIAAANVITQAAKTASRACPGKRRGGCRDK